MEKIFLNQTLDKNTTKKLLSWFLDNYSELRLGYFLDEMKSVGFHFATKAGFSLGFDDLRIPDGKERVLKQAELEIFQCENDFTHAKINSATRYQRLLAVWAAASESLKDEVTEYFEETDFLNPLYMMAFSGARGNMSQVRQLIGMRGLMSDSSGGVIDFPIRSNFREGLSVTEYAISCYGARKGLIDTALRTADSGYLTRRLVDVAQKLVIGRTDCGTNEYFLMHDLRNEERCDPEALLIPAEDRILGRLLGETLYFQDEKISPEQPYQPYAHPTDPSWQFYLKNTQQDRSSQQSTSVPRRSYSTSTSADDFVEKTQEFSKFFFKPVPRWFSMTIFPVRRQNKKIFKDHLNRSVFLLKQEFKNNQQVLKSPEKVRDFRVPLRNSAWIKSTVLDQPWTETPFPEEIGTSWPFPRKLETRDEWSKRMPYNFLKAKLSPVQVRESVSDSSFKRTRSLSFHRFSNPGLFTVIDYESREKKEKKPSFRHFSEKMMKDYIKKNKKPFLSEKDIWPESGNLDMTGLRRALRACPASTLSVPGARRSPVMSNQSSGEDLESDIQPGLLILRPIERMVLDMEKQTENFVSPTGSSTLSSAKRPPESSYKLFESFEQVSTKLTMPQMSNRQAHDMTRPKVQQARSARLTGAKLPEPAKSGLVYLGEGLPGFGGQYINAAIGETSAKFSGGVIREQKYSSENDLGLVGPVYFDQRSSAGFALARGLQTSGPVDFDRRSNEDNLQVYLLGVKNEEILPDLLEKISDYREPDQGIPIRSALTCRPKSVDWNIGKNDDICQYCYGWNLATGRLVFIGEAVGILAAQSIGEPGTQLTMRTFHTGGVFSAEVEAKVFAPHGGFISFSRKLPLPQFTTTLGQKAFFITEELQVKISQASHDSTEGAPTKSKLLRPGSTKLNFIQTYNESSLEERFVETEGQKMSSILELPPYSYVFVFPGQKVERNQVCAEISKNSGIPRKAAETFKKSKPVRLEIQGQIARPQKEVRRLENGEKKWINMTEAPGSASTSSVASEMTKLYQKATRKNSSIGFHQEYIWIFSGKPVSYPRITQSCDYISPEIPFEKKKNLERTKPTHLTWVSWISKLKERTSLVPVDAPGDLRSFGQGPADQRSADSGPSVRTNAAFSPVLTKNSKKRKRKNSHLVALEESETTNFLSFFAYFQSSQNNFFKTDESQKRLLDGYSDSFSEKSEALHSTEGTTGAKRSFLSSSLDESFDERRPVLERGLPSGAKLASDLSCAKNIDCSEFLLFSEEEITFQKLRKLSDLWFGTDPTAKLGLTSHTNLSDPTQSVSKKKKNKKIHKKPLQRLCDSIEFEKHFQRLLFFFETEKGKFGLASPSRQPKVFSKLGQRRSRSWTVGERLRACQGSGPLHSKKVSQFSRLTFDSLKPFSELFWKDLDDCLQQKKISEKQSLFVGVALTKILLSGVNHFPQFLNGFGQLWNDPRVLVNRTPARPLHADTTFGTSGDLQALQYFGILGPLEPLNITLSEPLEHQRWNFTLFDRWNSYYWTQSIQLFWPEMKPEMKGDHDMTGASRDLDLSEALGTRKDWRGSSEQEPAPGVFGEFYKSMFYQSTDGAKLLTGTSSGQGMFYDFMTLGMANSGSTSKASSKLSKTWSKSALTYSSLIPTPILREKYFSPKAKRRFTFYKRQVPKITREKIEAEKELVLSYPPIFGSLDEPQGLNPVLDWASLLKSRPDSPEFAEAVKETAARKLAAEIRASLRTKPLKKEPGLNSLIRGLPLAMLPQTSRINWSALWQKWKKVQETEWNKKSKVQKWTVPWKQDEIWSKIVEPKIETWFHINEFTTFAPVKGEPWGHKGRWPGWPGQGGAETSPQVGSDLGTGKSEAGPRIGSVMPNLVQAGPTILGEAWKGSSIPQNEITFVFHEKLRKHRAAISDWEFRQWMVGGFNPQNPFPESGRSPTRGLESSVRGTDGHVPVKGNLSENHPLGRSLESGRQFQKKWSFAKKLQQRGWSEEMVESFVFSHPNYFNYLKKVNESFSEDLPNDLAEYERSNGEVETGQDLRSLQLSPALSSRLDVEARESSFPEAKPKIDDEEIDNKTEKLIPLFNPRISDKKFFLAVELGEKESSWEDLSQEDSENSFGVNEKREALGEARTSLEFEDEVSFELDEDLEWDADLDLARQDAILAQRNEVGGPGEPPDLQGQWNDELLFGNEVLLDEWDTFGKNSKIPPELMLEPAIGAEGNPSGGVMESPEKTGAVISSKPGLSEAQDLRTGPDWDCPNSEITLREVEFFERKRRNRPVFGEIGEIHTRRGQNPPDAKKSEELFISHEHTFTRFKDFKLPQYNFVQFTDLRLWDVQGNLSWVKPSKWEKKNFTDLTPEAKPALATSGPSIMKGSKELSGVKISRDRRLNWSQLPSIQKKLEKGIFDPSVFYRSLGELTVAGMPFQGSIEQEDLQTEGQSVMMSSPLAKLGSMPSLDRPSVQLRAERVMNAMSFDKSNQIVRRTWLAKTYSLAYTLRLLHPYRTDFSRGNIDRSEKSLEIREGEILKSQEFLFSQNYQASRTADIVQGLPKIEQLFEARRSSPFTFVTLHQELKKQFAYFCEKFPPLHAARLSLRFIQRVLVDEIQLIYHEQGVEIHDKHVELIVRQMTRRVAIRDSGTTHFLPSSVVEIDILERYAVSRQKKYSQSRFNSTSGSGGQTYCRNLSDTGLVVEPVILGLTKTSLVTTNFLSAASFQEARRMLFSAATKSSVDFLSELKHDVLVGRYLRAGSTFHSNTRLSTLQKLPGMSGR